MKEIFSLLIIKILFSAATLLKLALLKLAPRKSALLKFLRNEHGGSQKPKAKITLTRKQNTEIRKTDSEGRARTIQVEVRKKRTIVKPDQSNRPITAPDLFKYI